MKDVWCIFYKVNIFKWLEKIEEEDSNFYGNYIKVNFVKEE